MTPASANKTASITHRARPDDPTITIVIPARNEARNLDVVLHQLPAVHQVILVDGNSVDETIAVARRILPTIEVIRQGRRGKGNALAHGFEAATGDVIVMFDADGSADSSEIGRFVNALTDGADFAKGSRFAPGGGSVDITRFRGFGNKLLNVIANATFRQRYTDLCYGYNAFWTDVLPILDLPDTSLPMRKSGQMIWGDGFEIETLINCRVAAAGLVITEVPSVEQERIHGASNLNAVRDGMRVLRTIRQEWVRARRIADRAVNNPAAIASPHTDTAVTFTLAEEHLRLATGLEEIA